MIKKVYNKYGEFIRFCIVGVICTLIDAAIFYLFRTFANYQVSLVSGYIISLLVNYFLTVYWTFKVNASVNNAFRIVFAHLFNLFVVRMSLMYLFINITSINDRLAYIPTLIISVVTNFIILKFIIKK